MSIPVETWEGYWHSANAVPLAKTFQQHATAVAELVSQEFPGVVILWGPPDAEGRVLLQAVRQNKRQIAARDAEKMEEYATAQAEARFKLDPPKGKGFFGSSLKPGWHYTPTLAERSVSDGKEAARSRGMFSTLMGVMGCSVVLMLCCGGGVYLLGLAGNSGNAKQAQKTEPHDDLTVFVARFGPPDSDKSSENEVPRPLIVTRRLVYNANGRRIRATYHPDVPVNTPPPYTSWKLIGFQDDVTNEVIQPADVVTLLEARKSGSPDPAPATPAELPAEPVVADQAPAVAPGTTAAEDLEAKALKKLKLGQQLQDGARRREWLRGIVKEFPGTQAAADAEADLANSQK